MAKHRFDTRAVHARLKTPEISSQSIAPPLIQTASFAFDHAPDIADACERPEDGFIYSRLSNPTVDMLERTIADLEGGDAALAFGSGMAAIHAALVGLLSAGDHIVAPVAVYGGTFGLLTRVLNRLGIESTFVDNNDPQAWRDAIRPNTKVVYAETIANPALSVPDLESLAALAHGAKAKLVVDSTFATPYLCRPLEHGADVVVHSASKYLGGHGDLIAGLVIGAKQVIEPIRDTAIEVGGAVAPFVAWLVLRGLKTLGIRVARSSSSALFLARKLQAHPKVKRVLYPGLSSHPDRERAKRYLPKGCSGVLAIELVGEKDNAERFMSALTLFQRAASLGDAHSLAIQPAATTHRQLSAQELARAGISETYVRLSVGLEDPEDLLEDLEQALTR